jgi:hypothetical protein
MKGSGHYIFHEEQEFRSTWLVFPIILGVLTLIVMMSVGLYQQIELGKPWGDQPMSDNELILTSVSSVIVAVLIALIVLKMRLITEVRQDGFFFRFPILMNKERCISPESIDHFEVGKYHPLRDYGGWGIRIRPLRGRAYNIKGNMGATFFLKNGKKVLFGTQRPDELRKALEKMMNQQNR